MSFVRPRRLFERKPPKLLYLYGFDPEDDEQNVAAADVSLNEDQEDRLPRKIFVRVFDIFFFCLAIVTYLSDFISDIFVAYLHFAAGRYWSGAIILAPAVLCSLTLNIVSIGFILEDELGPIVYYILAIRRAIKFRNEKDEKTARKHFRKMVEAERDATLLRCFEAFLESLPQLFLQGTILAQYLNGQFVAGELPIWGCSVITSLLSACWSISIHHRSLRMSLGDKVNMYPHESFLQFIWRACTVLSRFIIIILGFMAFGAWMGLFFGLHFVISLLHITALQSVEATFPAIELGLLVVNSFIHLTTPFNMAEGKTRRQYTVAYTVEFLEGAILAALMLTNKSFKFRWKFECIATAGILFIFGISVMCLYYGFCHPNRRRHLRIECDGVKREKTVETTVAQEMEEITEASIQISEEQPSTSHHAPSLSE
ncbi:unnamed protein product, partial [Mesorhabditis spiculigera]